MARAASSQASLRPVAAMSFSRWLKRVASSGSPMTPVEARKTLVVPASGSLCGRFARDAGGLAATLAGEGIGVAGIDDQHAALPPGQIAPAPFDRRRGDNFDRVKTPATRRPLVETHGEQIVRPGGAYLMPASAVAIRTPPDLRHCRIALGCKRRTVVAGSSAIFPRITRPAALAQLGLRGSLRCRGGTDAFIGLAQRVVLELDLGFRAEFLDRLEIAFPQDQAAQLLLDSLIGWRLLITALRRAGSRASRTGSAPVRWYRSRPPCRTDDCLEFRHHLATAEKAEIAAALGGARPGNSRAPVPRSRRLRRVRR